MILGMAVIENGQQHNSSLKMATKCLLHPNWNFEFLRIVQDFWCCISISHQVGQISSCVKLETPKNVHKKPALNQYSNSWDSLIINKWLCGGWVVEMWCKWLRSKDGYGGSSTMFSSFISLYSHCQHARGMSISSHCADCER